MWQDVKCRWHTEGYQGYSILARLQVMCGMLQVLLAWKLYFTASGLFFNLQGAKDEGIAQGIAVSVCPCLAYWNGMYLWWECTATTWRWVHTSGESKISDPVWWRLLGSMRQTLKKRKKVKSPCFLFQTIFTQFQDFCIQNLFDQNVLICQKGPFWMVWNLRGKTGLHPNTSCNLCHSMQNA